MSRPDLHINTGHEEEEIVSSQDEYSDEGESVSRHVELCSPSPRARHWTLARPPQLLTSCSVLALPQSSASIDPDIDFDLNYAL